MYRAFHISFNAISSSRHRNFPACTEHIPNRFRKGRNVTFNVRINGKFVQVRLSTATRKDRYDLSAKIQTRCVYGRSTIVLANLAEVEVPLEIGQKLFVIFRMKSRDGYFS